MRRATSHARRFDLARIAHRLSAAETDPAALTTLFLPFDLDVFQHAVARKSANKYRHINRLRSLAAKPGERYGLEHFK